MSEAFAPLFAPSAGFASDARFASPGEAAAPPPAAAPEDEPAHEPEDPLEVAFARGLAEGMAQAEALARARDEENATAREALALSFARLDRGLEEELRLRLRDTVAALCEAAILPLALDEAALAARVERAVAMLARADDDRVIRLHPLDMELVAPRLSAEWRIEPDPALERGALRVETATGGVEDGPAQWRRAIAEALHQC